MEFAMVHDACICGRLNDEEMNGSSDLAQPYNPCQLTDPDPADSP